MGNPSAIFFFSFFFPVLLAGLAMMPPPYKNFGLFLFTSNGPPRTFSCPGIGAGPLAANGQTLTMSKTTVCPQVHESFDRHRQLSPQVAFHLVLLVDQVTDGRNL
jgi:hypothetical protein